MYDFFPLFKKVGFLGILDPPYCGIGATIRIGREMLCLPYAGFLLLNTGNNNGGGPHRIQLVSPWGPTEATDYRNMNQSTG